MSNRRSIRWGAALLAGSAVLGAGAATSPASLSDRGSSALDRIRSVTAAPERIGPLVTRISGPRKSGKVDGGEYVNYKITFANHGHEPLSFVNNKSARFYGANHGLAIADAGCGFGSEPGGDVEPACQDNLEFIGLDPGESRAKTITAYAGLRGMGALEDGDYTHKRRVRIRRRGYEPRKGLIRFTFSVGG